MDKKFIVTPWKVEGDVDYNRLVKEFGTQEIDDKLIKKLEKAAGDVHYLIRRKIFFSHRDLNWILDENDKGNKFFLYTGRGPSGHTTLGNIIPWLLTKWFQDKFGADLWFQITDDEKFLFNPKLNIDDTQKLAYDNALDLIALGFDHKKTKIFTDIDYAHTLYPQALKVAKKLNFSTVKAVFGFENDSNVGQIFFTSVQSVPAFLPSVFAGKNIPCLIPHAIDQDAHFRISRDILPKLGFYKPAAIHCRFLPALTSESKMSTSGGNDTIFTTDNPEDVERKIKKYAFSGGKNTIEEHRKQGGDPHIDISYQWLTFFEEDDKKLKKIYDEYLSGKLLSGELKQILIDKLNNFLKKHHENRKKAEKVLDKFIVKD